MTALFSAPKAPQVVQVPVQTATTAAPQPSTQSTANAAQAAAIAQGTGLGQGSTIFTSGLGDTSTPTLAKKVLLGS